ncbi:MAG: ATP-binding cassette domain-containing protein [Actinomyces sp.]|nr:MAG: ATP-binding cassette domain-containing protein [Actinomyces sp.]
MFTLHGVGLTIDGTRILDGIDLRIPDEGITVIVGPSGSGKSSLLRLLDRLEVPTEGRILFRGVDLDDIDPPHLRRRVALVFQRPPLFEGTVLDNFRVARPSIDTAGAQALCARVGLEPGLCERRAQDLSGGEAQRLCFARALATDPSVVLADEPTAALDPDAAAGIEGLARALADEGIPLVWVTHDPGQVDRLADRVVHLAGGRLVP